MKIKIKKVFSKIWQNPEGHRKSGWVALELYFCDHMIMLIFKVFEWGYTVGAQIPDALGIWMVECVWIYSIVDKMAAIFVWFPNGQDKEKALLSITM